MEIFLSKILKKIVNYPRQSKKKFQSIYNIKLKFTNKKSSKYYKKIKVYFLKLQKYLQNTFHS